MDTSDKEKVIYKTITETVIHGRGIGKHVGTPTANLKVEKQIDLSETGVYFSTILLCNQFFYGVTHIGTRPTLDNDKEISIETHILNFDKDIYGCTITIALYKRIREIQKFDNLSLLLKQIRKDCVAAQKYWRIKNQTAILVMDKETHCAMINSQCYTYLNHTSAAYKLPPAKGTYHLCTRLRRVCRNNPPWRSL